MQRSPSRGQYGAKRPWAVWKALLVVMAVASCATKPASTSRGSDIGYPKGKWRVLDTADLNEVALWVSHIVIAHRESNPSATRLRPYGWKPDGPPPERTKGEAMMLALRLADELARSPSLFEEYARKYSDDAVSRDGGGSLGGVRAGQLPITFIDALAVLKPGEVSHVIETSFGYHIVKRRPVPAEEIVSGERIVVRYGGTYGGRGLDGAVTRSHDEARAIAEKVVAEARRGEVPFVGLVNKYSENADREEGGDMGAYSVRDPRFSPVEVEQLSRLKTGEVSAPFDSSSGFQIVRRTEARPREQFAMNFLVVPFETEAPPDSANSAKNVLPLARATAQRIAKDPAAFEAERRKTCCEEPLKWTAGRGLPGMTPVVRTLAIGEIAPTAVEAENGYYVVRRIAPETVSDDRPPLYDIPIPEGVDLERVVRFSRPASLAVKARELDENAQKVLNLDSVRRAELSRVLEKLAKRFADTGIDAEADRLSVWKEGLGEIQKLLGAADFGRFQAFLKEWATNQAIEQPWAW